VVKWENTQELVIPLHGYIEQYEKIAPQSQPMTTIWKCPYSAIDDDDFEQMVASLSSDATINEYDG